MLRDNTLGTSWPPRGWESLEFVKNLSAQAIVKDPISATIEGAYYKIEPIPTFGKNSKQIDIYHLEINGWQYSIQNESHEYKILSFMFRGHCDQSITKERLISDIRTKSRPVLLTRRSANRSYIAATLMIKQILSGKVPDYERVLRLYKIHPTQRSLYEMDCLCHDPFNCGLPVKPKDIMKTT